MPDLKTGQPASLGRLVEIASLHFAERYGAQPEFVVAAPGRVNLIGEHTDYNAGFVLPMAIERCVVIAGRKINHPPSQRIRITSQTVDATVEILLDAPIVPSEPVWANYVRGVIAGFLNRRVALPSIDAVMASDVPLGGGLSSSAALEVATATLLEVASSTHLNSYDKARLCQKAEHEFAHVPCGIMDQLISVLGDSSGALLIDCQSESARVIPIADPSVSILIMNTNVRHDLASGEYGLRRRQCHEASRKLGVKSLREATLELLTSKARELDALEFKRARHVITENDRTVRAAQALSDNNLRLFGQLMYESHESLRSDYEVSCRELDVLVQSAQALGEDEGVLGARMTGGGFGGCTITLVRTDRVAQVEARLLADYVSGTGRIATSFVSRPMRGAHRVS